MQYIFIHFLTEDIHTFHQCVEADDHHLNQSIINKFCLEDGTKTTRSVGYPICKWVFWNEVSPYFECCSYYIYLHFVEAISSNILNRSIVIYRDNVQHNILSLTILSTWFRAVAYIVGLGLLFKNNWIPIWGTKIYFIYS